ncbi:MAG: hypothetical protein IJY92_02840 [Alphaproteobacteria bacterium]|nr:hypothetical protein [Alphaproteobacteria bacterium]
MVKIKKSENNLMGLKTAKELLQTPLVYEAFLMMLDASSYLKNMPLCKKKVSNHLDKMVFETDRYADQKIQKLRYLLKKNEIVRKKLVERVSKECRILCVSHCLKCLEENLGVDFQEKTEIKDVARKINASKRNFPLSDGQVKS